MTVEAILQRDGGLVAVPTTLQSTTGNGAGGTGQFLLVTLSTTQNEAFNISSSAGAGGPVYGVLQNTPAAGQPGDISIAGITKVVAGSTFSAGQRLMSSSLGQVTSHTSGSGYFVAGYAREAATVAGQLLSMTQVPLGVVL